MKENEDNTKIGDKIKNAKHKHDMLRMNLLVQM